MPPSRKPRAQAKPKEAKIKLKSNPIADLKNAIEGAKLAKVRRLSSTDVLCHVTDYAMSAGLDLDRVLGGGFPCGRVTEIFGPEGIGKSTVLAHTLAAVQREGGIGVLIDTEETADLSYFKLLGVDVDKLVIIQFDRGKQTIEGVFEAISQAIEVFSKKHPKIKVVIGWDSIAGTSAQTELDNHVGESHGAKPAQILKRGMRRIVPNLAGTKIACVFTNHMYENVGGYGHGPKKSVYGGKGIAMLATTRIEFFLLETLKDDDGVVIGKKIGCKLWKIKTNKNWGHVAELCILAGIGIDNVYTIFNALYARGHIVFSGQWYAMTIEGEEPLRWQKGFTGLGKLLRERPHLFPKLVAIYQAIMAPPPVTSEAPADPKPDGEQPPTKKTKAKAA